MSPSSAESTQSFARFKLDLPALAAIRESLPWSFAGLLAALPVFMALTPAPANASNLLAGLAQRLSLAELPAFTIMGATLAVLLSLKLASHLKLNRAIVLAATCAAFLLALPRPGAAFHWLAYLRHAGESGLFLAILAALCVAGASWYGRKIGGRFGEAAGALVVVAGVGVLFAYGISASDGLAAALTPLAKLGDSYVALLLIVIVETLLWMIGIHGPATLAAIVTPIYLTLQFQNTAAYARHEPLPHIVTVSLFLFVFPGGAGATLPIAFLLLRSRVRRLRLLARATVLPAIFNLNEPLLFGLPIVLNQYLAAPFLIVPILTATLAYLAVAGGAVARPAFYIPAALPTPFATYFATLDWRAVVLALVNIAVASILYAPFVFAYERHILRLEAVRQDDTV